MSRTIQFRLNGESVQVEASEDTRLVDVLSDDLGMTGTKFCCGIGVCRACTVGARSHPDALEIPMLSCSTPISAVEGYDIRTVEGLADGDRPSLLQESFLEHFAFQCGYCTPGFLMAATLLLERLQASPIHESEIDDAIEEACGAHICRCTGYVKYYEAMRKAILETEGAVR